MWRIFAAYLLIVSTCAVAYFVLGMSYPPQLSLLQAILESIIAISRTFLLGIVLTRYPSGLGHGLRGRSWARHRRRLYCLAHPAFLWQVIDANERNISSAHNNCCRKHNEVTWMFKTDGEKYIFSAQNERKLGVIPPPRRKMSTPQTISLPLGWRCMPVERV